MPLPPISDRVKPVIFALAALFISLTTSQATKAQVHHLKPLDLNLSITQGGSVAETIPAFNRLVVSITDEPFELVTLEIGNAPLQICVSTGDNHFLSTRPGELISSLPCFNKSLETNIDLGTVIDGWPMAVADGSVHWFLPKEFSLGLGNSRVTRFSGLHTAGSSVAPEVVHLAIVIDQNQNGQLDVDEYSFMDLEINRAPRTTARREPLDDVACKQLLLSEADRIETELLQLSTRYAERLGSHFSADQFSGDTTAVQETRGVFTILARDHFEDMFLRVKGTPQQFRRTAAMPTAVACRNANDIKDTADIAIATYRQLWEATLELASTTIRGWRKVYHKLGQ